MTRVVPIGLGLWGLAGPNQVNGITLGWPDLDTKTIDAVVGEALEHGIRIFDTSDMYGQGRGETLLGDRQHRLPPDVRIFTKGGLDATGAAPAGRVPRRFDPYFVDQALSASLRRLQADHVAVYFLHGPTHDALKDPYLWRQLQQRQAAGDVAGLGVSLRRSGLADPTYLAAVADNPAIEYVQAPINPFYPDLMRRLGEGLFADKKIVARSVFGHGFFLKTDLTRMGADDHRLGLLREDQNGRIPETVGAVRSYAADQGIDVSSLLLSAAVSFPQVNCVLIGARSHGQIAQVCGWMADLPVLEDRALYIDACERFSENAA